MDQDGTWHEGGPWSRPHCAKWEPSSPPQKGGRAPPTFGPFLLWPNGWIIKIPLGMEIGLSPGDFVLDGNPAPSPERGQSSQFSAHVYCGQTAACIRIPLDTEGDRSIGDIVLDGDPALPPLKGHSPQFSTNVRCGQTAGWTKMLLGTEVGLGSATLCSMGSQFPQTKRAQPPPNFWLMSIVAKRLDRSRCHLVRR